MKAIQEAIREWKGKGSDWRFPPACFVRIVKFEHRKPKAAKSGKELMYEEAMMDRDAMGTAGFNSRERAELWLEHGLNSFRDKVRAEQSQVFEYESRDAESYNQEAPVDASHEIEGSRGCTVLDSIKDNSEKANKQLCSISRAISENGDAPDIGV